MDVLKAIKNEIRSSTANDPAHDYSHTMRVYRNAEKICRAEHASKKLVLSAALLHDIVIFPKSDRRSKMAAVKSALKSRKILKKYGFSLEEIQIVHDAIRDHSFSAHKIPESKVGKILQDADRLDAMGAIGIARVFVVSGSEHRPLYNEDDPFCTNRIPDDKLWTLDHFYKKLLVLESLMNTKSGRIEAKKRTKVLRKFLVQFKKEI